MSITEFVYKILQNFIGIFFSCQNSKEWDCSKSIDFKGPYIRPLTMTTESSRNVEICGKTTSNVLMYALVLQIVGRIHTTYLL